jgi:CRISPR-associated protein Cas1
MKSLYISQPGCSVSLKQEQLLVKRNKEILQTVQLPHLEQIFIFSASQVTTQAIHACLWRQIPIVYLSRTGRCYGRITPIESKFRHLPRSQQNLSSKNRLITARSIIATKIRNSRVLLQRQSRRLKTDLSKINKGLHYLEHRAQEATTTEQLMGFEGAAAAAYFGTLGQCITGPGFTFKKRSRRPPEYPVNAMLSSATKSFGTISIA